MSAKQEAMESLLVHLQLSVRRLIEMQKLEDYHNRLEHEYQPDNKVVICPFDPNHPIPVGAINGRFPCPVCECDTPFKNNPVNAIDAAKIIRENCDAGVTNG
jgi:hypothetical protein